MRKEELEQEGGEREVVLAFVTIPVKHGKKITLRGEMDVPINRKVQ